MTCMGVLESDDLARSSVCLCSYWSWIQPTLFSYVYIQRSVLTIRESIKKRSTTYFDISCQSWPGTI